MWKKGQYVLCCVVWIIVVEIRAASLRTRKTAFEKIEIVNSRYGKSKPPLLVSKILR